MTDITNLTKKDPLFDDEVGNSVTGEDYIHIRIQQRNGRKTLTTVQGLPDKFDLKKITKSCKKVFACNGTVVEHPEYGEVIQLQGDQRAKIQEFLVANQLANNENIKVHGF